MKKDILTILVCISIGVVIMGCRMAEVFLAESAFDAATDAVTEAIFPRGKGEFKGVNLGMTRAEVKKIIEKSNALNPVESVIEEIDQATTVMWNSEKWVYFSYHEGRLYCIAFGTELYPEDLIETELRRQFRRFHQYISIKFSSTDYKKKGFSWKKITVSSFEELPFTLTYAWIDKDVEWRLWLRCEDSKYGVFATIWNRNVIAKLREENKGK